MINVATQEKQTLFLYKACIKITFAGESWTIIMHVASQGQGAGEGCGPSPSVQSTKVLGSLRTRRSI